MLTTLALIVILILVVWPESRIKLEHTMQEKTPRLHIVTFKALEHYHADYERRFPDQQQQPQLPPAKK
jgi:hypothetical protein